MMASPERYLSLALLGPTASGKSAFAIELAHKLNAEIICLDSTTPYRGFNIGSSKPNPSQQKEVPHHLLDILEPEAPFSAGEFVRRADAVISEIHSRKKLPLIVGGTYFYLKSLQHGMYDTPPVDPQIIESLEKVLEDQENGLSMLYQELSDGDPACAFHIHPNDSYRIIRSLSILRGTGKKPSKLSLIPFSQQSVLRLWIKYALVVPRHELTQTIALRTDTMLNQGLVEETRLLREKCPEARALSSIGYAECLKFLDKKIDHKQLRNEIIEKTRQLAKRQMTWLRSDPEIRFVDSRDSERVKLEVSNLEFALRTKGSSS